MVSPWWGLGLISLCCFHGVYLGLLPLNGIICIFLPLNQLLQQPFKACQVHSLHNWHMLHPQELLQVYDIRHATFWRATAMQTSLLGVDKPVKTAASLS
jgi:hypothetical protein